MAISFLHARRQVVLFQPVNSKRRPLEASRNILPAKVESIKKIPYFYPPSFLPAWHWAMWGGDIPLGNFCSHLASMKEVIPKISRWWVERPEEPSSSVTTLWASVIGLQWEITISFLKATFSWVFCHVLMWQGSSPSRFKGPTEMPVAQPVSAWKGTGTTWGMRGSLDSLLTLLDLGLTDCTETWRVTQKSLQSRAWSWPGTGGSYPQHWGITHFLSQGALERAWALRGLSQISAVRWQKSQGSGQRPNLLARPK